MGLIRVELMTPSLSEKCSNQLSYRPYKKRGRGKEQALGKRVRKCLVYFKTYRILKIKTIYTVLLKKAFTFFNYLPFS